MDPDLTTSTEDEDEHDEDYDDDEEARIGKKFNFLGPSSHRHKRIRSQTMDPHTLVTRNSEPLSASRLRRKTFTESHEIWEELEDALPLPLPLSPWYSSHKRSASSKSTPSIPPARNASRARAEGGDVGADDEILDEDTPLLGRSGTGRTYRDRRRRRSAPVLGRGGGGGEEAQAATGGWWRMGWWGESGKGKGRSTPEGSV